MIQTVNEAIILILINRNNATPISTILSPDDLIKFVLIAKSVRPPTQQLWIRRKCDECMTHQMIFIYILDVSSDTLFFIRSSILVEDRRLQIYSSFCFSGYEEKWSSMLLNFTMNLEFWGWECSKLVFNLNSRAFWALMSLRYSYKNKNCKDRWYYHVMFYTSTFMRWQVYDGFDECFRLIHIVN